MNKKKLQFLIIALMMGTFFIPLNSTIIAIGLSAIADSFSVPINDTYWIITIYVIVMAAAQPVAGKLGDIFGYKRMFLIGIGLSLVGSIACVFSFNLPAMIAFRSFQALGGALSIPNATALIRIVIPEEKLSRILGLFGFQMGIGAAVGPLVGSLLINAWGWNAIFWINIPFLLLSLIMSLVLMPVTPVRKAKIDLLGALSFVSVLTIIALSVTQPEMIHWWSIIILIALLLFFLYHESRHASPLIDFKLFNNRLYVTTNFSMLLSTSIMYGTILIMPIVLLKQGMGLGTIGFLLFIYALTMSCAAVFGGWLAAKLNHKKIISISFLIQLFSLLLYLTFYQDLAFWFIAIALIIGGFGSGVGLPSMQTSNLLSVQKDKTGVASGVFSTFRYIGSMMGSILTTVFVGSQTFFFILIGIAMVGVLLSANMKGQNIIGDHART